MNKKAVTPPVILALILGALVLLFLAIWAGRSATQGGILSDFAKSLFGTEDKEEDIGFDERFEICDPVEPRGTYKLFGGRWMSLCEIQYEERAFCDIDPCNLNCVTRVKKSRDKWVFDRCEDCSEGTCELYIAKEDCEVLDPCSRGCLWNEQTQKCETAASYTDVLMRSVWPTASTTIKDCFDASKDKYYVLIDTMDGEPVKAIAPGFIRISDKTATVFHKDGYYSVYKSLGRLRRKNGNVNKGEIIGWAGDQDIEFRIITLESTYPSRYTYPMYFFPQIDQASQCYQKVPLKYIELGESYYLNGTKLYDEGKKAEAEVLFQKALVELNKADKFDYSQYNIQEVGVKSRVEETLYVINNFYLQTEQT